MWSSIMIAKLISGTEDLRLKINSSFPKEKLSIVVPCRNEYGCLEIIFKLIENACSEIDALVELIFVDDSSTDGTWEKISEISLRKKKNFNIKGIRLSSQCGQQVAIIAGYKEATGDFVLSMDADGQHPAELIPNFWGLRNKECAIVGVQRSYKTSRVNALFSSVFYRIYEVTSGLKVQKKGGDFRLLSKEILEGIQSSFTQYAVIRFVLVNKKIKVIPILFDARDRVEGTSKYSLRSRFIMAMKAIITAENFIDRSIFLLFLLNLCFSLISPLFYLVAKYFMWILPEWTVTLTIISFFSLLQISALYLLCAVLRNSMMISKASTPYIVVQRV
jgi:glycosyltransferase involved in cell wall biosynthesis